MGELRTNKAREGALLPATTLGLSQARRAWGLGACRTPGTCPQERQLLLVDTPSPLQGSQHKLYPGTQKRVIPPYEHASIDYGHLLARNTELMVKTRDKRVTTATDNTATHPATQPPSHPVN